MLGWLLSAWHTVKPMIGRPFRDWAEWAEENPGPAARQLEVVSAVFRHRAEAYKRHDGWRARRDRRLASALLEQAQALRHAETDEHVQAACAVRPGEWTA